MNQDIRIVLKADISSFSPQRIIESWNEIDCNLLHVVSKRLSPLVSVLAFDHFENRFELYHFITLISTAY